MSKQVTKTNNNPFANSATAAQSGALVEIESARAIQEVQAQMIVAKKFPRDESASMQRIIKACGRVTLAEQAIYAYNRGDTTVKGPSIRLAESIAQNWGNIQFGVVELGQENGVSTVQAYAWDVETNTKLEKKFQVTHMRHTKKGSYKLTDPRDIYELVANNGARRLRACILGIIPGDVIEAALQECQQTQITNKNNATVTPEKINQLVSAFAAIQVTEDMIIKYINCPLKEMTATQLVDLRSIYTSLRDGMAYASDFFEVKKVDVEKSRLDNLMDGEDMAIDPEIEAKAEAYFKAKS